MKKLIMLVMFLMPVFVYANEQQDLNSIFANELNSADVNTMILSNEELASTEGSFFGPWGMVFGGAVGGFSYIYSAALSGSFGLGGLVTSIGWGGVSGFYGNYRLAILGGVSSALAGAYDASFHEALKCTNLGGWYCEF